MRQWGLALCAVLILPNMAVGQETSRSSLTETYTAALRCVVADGHASGDRQRAGDTAKAAYYEGKGKDAFDAAKVVAKALGLSWDRFSADVQATQDRELPTMVNDDAYFRRAVADCKAMGLM